MIMMAVIILRALLSAGKIAFMSCACAQYLRQSVSVGRGHTNDCITERMYTHGNFKE